MVALRDLIAKAVTKRRNINRVSISVTCALVAEKLSVREDVQERWGAARIAWGDEEE